MKQNSDGQLAQEIAEFIQKNPEIDEFEVLVVDIGGHFFGKRYPIAKLKSFAHDGLAFPMSTLAVRILLKEPI